MHFISSLGNGGAEKLSVELSNSMSDDNEVLLVSFKKIEDWMHFPRRIVPKVRLLSLNKKPGFSFNLLKKIIILLREEKPDIVNLHLDSVFNYFAIVLSFFKFFIPRKISFFYTIHSALISSNRRKFDIISKFNFSRLNYICVSPQIYENFSLRYNSKTFNLIENGCAQVTASDNIDRVKNEIDAIKNNSDTKIILAIGRISPAKNYKLMLKTISDFKDKNLKLILIGDDSLEGKPLLKDLKKMNTDIVQFVGNVEFVADYLYNSDALILSSTHEGMPISVIEAMSVGLPIICTPAGGLVDMVVPQKNGFIARDFTSSSLSNELKKFINSKDSEIEQIRRNNLNDFKDKYSLKKCSNEYLKLYTKIKNEL